MFYVDDHQVVRFFEDRLQEELRSKHRRGDFERDVEPQEEPGHLSVLQQADGTGTRLESQSAAKN